MHSNKETASVSKAFHARPLRPNNFRSTESRYRPQKLIIRVGYNDLDQTQKDFLSTLKIRAKKGIDHAVHKAGTTGMVVDGYNPDVVYTNIAGKTGLFFPFLQIESFVGMTPAESQAIIKPLAEFTIQEKYCYHHDWQDGDLVISEQWLGIHKRWKFEGIEKRMVHRAVFDFPDQDYK